MRKLSAQGVDYILRSSAGTIQKLATDLADEQERRMEAERELAKRDLDDRLQKLATEMDRKGLLQADSIEGQIEMLGEPQNLARLDAIEEGTNLAAGQVKLASIEHERGTEIAASGGAAEARFVGSLFESNF